MSSIKPLVQQECGQPNALVQLSNQVFSKPATSSKGSGTFLSRENDFAQEYLSNYHATTAAPSTFDMQNMLREINRPNFSQHHADRLKLPSNSNWTDEFFKSIDQQQMPNNADQWTADYLTERNLNEAWQNAASASHQPTALREPLKWSHEYLTEAENVQHPWNNEFMQFVQKVDSGEINLAADAAAASQQIPPQDEDYWNQLEDQWDNLAKSSEAHQWLNEYNDITSMYKNYQMQETNPYLDMDDPLTEGKKLLAAGELANAILCFESAVQKFPQNAESWQFLGTAQAENEQETKTIAALQKCLELDEKNLVALQSLAIAYTNESLYDAACRTLARWLSANERYAHLAPIFDASKYRPSSFVDRDLFKSVENAFMAATRESGNTVDPDLQNVFGVLYNLSGDLDRAIDCFRSALMVKPDDARLWNRLGATLANDSQSAEAISAYRKALELYPAFVRARYNLGISCLNLGSHWQAVEHFISALALQNRGVGPSGGKAADMSQGIWGTLRVAVMGLKSDRTDELLRMVDAKDFDALRNVLTQGPPPPREEASSFFVS